MDGSNDDYLKSKVSQYQYFTSILFWSFIITVPTVLMVMALISG